MARHSKSTIIQAPIDEVFRYFDDPANIPETLPSMQEVRDVKRGPRGGPNYSYVYKMAGMRFEGTAENLEYLRNQRIVHRSRADKGGIDVTITTRFEEVPGGTRVTIDADYAFPEGLVAKLREPVLHKMNERDLDVCLGNAKDKIEDRVSAKA